MSHDRNMATGLSCVTNEKMSRDEYLLEGEFEVFPNEKLLYKVEVTKHGITYYPLNEDRESKNKKYIHFGDVIGCRCRKSLDEKHLHKAYLTVFCYSLKKKLFSDKWVRNKHHVTFARSGDSSFEGNRKVVEKWRRVFLHLCQRLPIRNKVNGLQHPPQEDDALFDIDIEKCPVPPKKRLLVLVNPHSGPGKAMQIYEKHVAPMLDEADIQVKLVRTERAWHAYELVKKLNRKDFSGIVIVSGDGLIYEVINGLMSRDDWQDAIKIPVGCIPGGSGNALCCAINYSAGESIETEIALHSTFILIKHRVVPMDLVLVEQIDSRVYSFLSVCWGLFADIDYESETFRAIGEARFALHAIKRILALRKYRAKLSFLPLTQYIPRSSTNNNSKGYSIQRKDHRVSLQDFDNGESEDSGSFNERMRSKSMPTELFKRSVSSSLSYENGIEEQLADIPDEKGDSENQDKVDFNLVNDNESDGKAQTAQTAQKTNKLSVKCDSSNSTKDTGNAVQSTLLPPLDEPVPDDWITIESDFVTVVATYQSHLGSDIIMAPDAKFTDGLIHLCFMKAGIQKTELISLMGKLEKGTHIDHVSEHAEFVKVRAFRLEPHNNKGIVMVDGEKIECKPLQAEVLPGLANVMAIQ